MSLDRSVAGKFKLENRRVRKLPPSLTIGLVYEGIGKFYGKSVVGVLMEIYPENDEAVLQTKEKKFVSVDKKTLKIVVDD